MAYFSQAQKKQVAQKVRPILKENGLRGTLAVRNHSTVLLNIWSGPIDLLGMINAHRAAESERWGRPYHPAKYVTITRHELRSMEDNAPELHAIFAPLFEALESAGWYDRSDSQVDYFDTAYYAQIQVGTYKKAYQQK